MVANLKPIETKYSCYWLLVSGRLANYKLTAVTIEETSFPRYLLDRANGSDWNSVFKKY
ncbi:MAG: hypothetical protein Q7S22_04250 [Candidatus Micrarchaeota archaeon]|nr:hypothetical protein [Candidatus Micrarchaeota archaeon]